MTDRVNLTKSNLSRPAVDRKDFDSFNRTLWQIGASLCLIGGIGVLLGTIFLFVLEYFYGEKSHGTWTIFVAFVLLGFGAHCLDKIEEQRKTRRFEFETRRAASDRTRFERVIEESEITNS